MISEEMFEIKGKLLQLLLFLPHLHFLHKIQHTTDPPTLALVQLPTTTQWRPDPSLPLPLHCYALRTLAPFRRSPVSNFRVVQLMVQDCPWNMSHRESLHENRFSVLVFAYQILTSISVLLAAWAKNNGERSKKPKPTKTRAKTSAR